MKIIVGLGNPGIQYETTRHNVGFLAVDRLIDSWRATGPIIKHQAEIYSAKVDGEPVMILKPQTFMNLSGRSVAPLYHFYKCTPQDLIVIHDELDLDPLVFRLKTGGSAGGHNGLKSIDESIGKDQTQYHRVRIGIGHPKKIGLQHDVSDYVLGQFSRSELKELDSVLDRVEQAVKLVLQGKISQAMNQFH